MSAEPWISVPAAASYSDHHPKTILRALRRGELRGVQQKVGGTWRTRASYVDHWLAGDASNKKGRSGGTRAALVNTNR